MKLAVFYPASLWCAWSCSYGLVDTLRRMGNEVTGMPINPAKPVIDTDALLSGDGVIVSGPEHLRLSKSTKPTVAWMHETVEREDYGKLDVEDLKRSADIVFCPAIQDEQYGFRYLPFGVDTEIFHPDPTQEKTVDAGFIGLLYPKRQEFLQQLTPHLGHTKLTIGNVQVLEITGINPRKTAELYAHNLRSLKVLVNLPTLSQLAVTKIFEGLACGTELVTPAVSDMRNLADFPVNLYRDAQSCAAAICHPHDHGNHLAKWAHDNHRLELRCETLLAGLKECGAKVAA